MCLIYTRELITNWIKLKGVITIQSCYTDRLSYARNLHVNGPPQMLVENTVWEKFEKGHECLFKKRSLHYFKKVHYSHVQMNTKRCKSYTLDDTTSKTRKSTIWYLYFWDCKVNAKLFVIYRPLIKVSFRGKIHILTESMEFRNGAWPNARTSCTISRENMRFYRLLFTLRKMRNRTESIRI